MYGLYMTSLLIDGEMPGEVNSTQRVSCLETRREPCQCYEGECDGKEIFSQWMDKVDVLCAGSASCKNTTFPRQAVVKCSGTGSCESTEVCEMGQFGDGGLSCQNCPNATVSVDYRGLGPVSERCTVDSEAFDPDDYYVLENGTINKCLPSHPGCTFLLENGKCNTCYECIEGYYMAIGHDIGEHVCAPCSNARTSPPGPSSENEISRCTLCSPGAYGGGHFQCVWCPDSLRHDTSAGTGPYEIRCKRGEGLTIGETWAVIDGVIFLVCVFVLFGLRHWFYQPVRERNRNRLIRQSTVNQSAESEYETIDMRALSTRKPAVTTPPSSTCQANRATPLPHLDSIESGGEGPYDALESLAPASQR